MSLPVAIRPYDPATDVKFVFASWTGSYKGSKWAGTIPAHAEYTVHTATINQLLARGMSVLMAVNPENRDQILGFIAFEPGLLHYVFVKSIFRRQGVASSLMASANFDRAAGPVLASFRTTDARHIGPLNHKPHLARQKAPYSP